MNRSCVLTAGAVLCLVLSACYRRPSEQGATPAGESSPTTGFHEQFARGTDQAGIRAYLGSVRPLQPRRFEVTWSADTVRVSREEASRSLLRVSRDGTTFTFASSEPIVSQLTTGKVVWIWGIAIRRIGKVVRGAGVTLVHTSDVPLSEAMTHSDIEFDSPLDFGGAYAIARPAPAAAPAAAAQVARAPSALRSAGVRPRSFLMPVRYDETPEGLDARPQEEGSPGDAADLKGVEESDTVVATRDGYTGKTAGFEYSLAYKVSGSKLAFELQARKEDEEPAGAGESNEMLRDERHEFFEAVHEQQQAEHEADEAYERQNELTAELADIKAFEDSVPPAEPNAKLGKLDKQALETLKKYDEAERQHAQQKYDAAEAKVKAAQDKARKLAMAGAIAKQVFYILSDNLDIRFRTRVELSKAAIAAAVRLSPGSNAGTTVSFKDLSGKIDLEVVARMGLSGNGGVSIPVTHIPLVFNIPLVINGVPFIVQVGTDFLVKIALAGRHAAHHFHAQFNFNGTAGFTTSAASQSDTNFNLSGGEPEVQATEASSPGVSGTVVAVQIPRLGMGVGVFGAAALGYVDQVVVLTMTNGAGVATLNPACKRYTLDRIAHVGADVTTVLPIPVVQQMLQLLSWKKEVWRAKQWIRVEPDIAMCRI